MLAVVLSACGSVTPLPITAPGLNAVPLPEVAPQDPTPPESSAPQDPQDPTNRYRLSIPDDEDADWIQLVSGEWLRGEFTVLRDGTVEFDSDEIEELELDWDDILQVRIPRTRTILLEDGETFSGPVVVRTDEVVVEGDEPVRIDRARVIAIVTDAEHELDYWSGKLTLGLTQRSGNTNQTDFSAYAFTRRETPATRWDTTYNGAFSKVEGIETANNHRLQSRFDWFLSSRLYVTPLGLGLFRDTFQNIKLRTTPYVAVGYDVVDEGSVSWSLSGGPAYQRIDYYRVQPGEPESDDTAAAVFQSRFEWDVTPDVEFDFEYDLTVPVPDTQEYNHHAAFVLSVDLTSDFDVDIAFIWDRVNDPIADENGVVPEKDDFRTEIGIGWEF